MEPVYSDPKGACANLAFVDSTDNSVFHPKIFGLPEKTYANLKDMASTLVGIETFLNWYRFNYEVQKTKVDVVHNQAHLSQEMLASIAERAAYRMQQYGHACRLGESRARQDIVIQKEDGTFKTVSMELGKYVDEPTKNMLKTHIEKGFTKIILPGYRAVAEDVRCRVVIHRGRYQTAASIADGGNLHQVFSPFDSHYTFLNDGENHAIAVPVGCKAKAIGERWEQEKAGWILVGQFMLMMSHALDIPRHELIQIFRKTAKSQDPIGYVQAIQDFQKKMGISHALRSFIKLQDFYKDLRTEKPVRIEDWVGGLALVKPTDAQMKEKSSKCLWLAFKYGFREAGPKAVAEAQNGHIYMMRFGEKTAHLKAYDECWKIFAADMRAML